MRTSLVLGLDVGGTSTRAVLASIDGKRVGTGRAGGGNPTTHGPAAAGHLKAALGEALTGVEPAAVRAGTIGLAGGARLGADPDARTAFDRVWRDAGLRCEYAVVSDALAAYAAGTPAPDGTVLIAGTGAIAAEICDLAVARVADGHGWLLGDAGSGFWLGREAVRRTLADLDAGREPAPLSRLVLRQLLGAAAPAEPSSRAMVESVVQAVTRRPPVELAALSNLVMRAYAAGDAGAREIVDEAARLLSASIARIRPADAVTPVVLGGGLLTTDTPLARAVSREIDRRWPAAPRRLARNAAAGAAWLAARGLPEVTDPLALHHKLLPTDEIASGTDVPAGAGPRRP
ncbi:MAG TPA: BadF/BadG/BcrA/BcrD ATPase family protein [Micromonosporaceae bacterium]